MVGLGVLGVGCTVCLPAQTGLGVVFLVGYVWYSLIKKEHVLEGFSFSRNIMDKITSLNEHTLGVEGALLGTPEGSAVGLNVGETVGVLDGLRAHLKSQRVCEMR